MSTVETLVPPTSTNERCRMRVIVNRPDAMELVPQPINPDWIIAGNPVARSALHSASFDGWAGTGIWDCSAGTFHWHFGSEESLMILEGEVHVTDDHGVTTVLTSGAIGYFPAGSHFVWHVPEYVRKIVYYRREVPVAVRRVYAVRSLIGRSVRFAARLPQLLAGKLR